VASPPLIALAHWPDRAPARRRPLPEIQFDIGDFIPPARTIDGVAVRMPPVYTSFTTLRLTGRQDRAALERALAAVEARFPFSPRGAMVMVGYGRPYFERIGRTVPQLADAERGPTDPPHTKLERNDLLFVVRSDSAATITRALELLTKPDCLRVTSRRLSFHQLGLPRKIAERHELPYAAKIDPRSPMWMGFGDQQVGSSAPPAAIAFKHGPLAGGAILHLSHLIEDLDAFYAEPYEERLQAVFRSNPPPPGPARVFIDTPFRRGDDAVAEQRATGRVGHVSALQRASRDRQGTPLHIRLDAPGFDALDTDVARPKLHFAMLVPTAERFAKIRRAQASPDLATDHRGIERFITATRRQNFVIPPRRQRAFPLL
jgi:hypothetical protein